MTDAVVHIVDDDAAARQSLAFLLSAAGMPVRVYESATAFLAAAATAQRGCLVTDLRMPDINGVELLQKLSAYGLQLPAIVVTGHGDVPMAVEAMKAGATDFIEKPFDDETILAAVRIACEQHQGGNSAAYRHEVLMRFKALTGRESQVVALLVKGHPNKVIAHELGISVRTVEVHRGNAMNKMEAGSLSELVRMSIAAEMAQAGRLS